jgi:O-antigen ligase
MADPACPTPDVQRTPGGLFLAGAMLVCMPLVAIQGPGHTTPMDGVNLLFVGCSWIMFLVRHRRFALPLIAPFWVILVGSLLSLYGTPYLARAALVLAEDVYLYLWFITLADFLARRCDMGGVGMIWTGVACTVAVLTLADEHFGVLGGLFSGTRRATGTFENPNMFGDYLVLSFFVAWATAAGGRPLWYFALALLFAGIRATASNGALVALLGGVGATWAASSSFWSRKSLGLVAIAGAILIAIVGVWHEEIEEFAVAQMSASRGEVGGAAMKGASERLPIWEHILGLVAENPLGVGPGNLADVNAETTGDDHGAHNEYFGMLGERGVLGLAGWLALLASVLAMLMRLRAAAAAGYRPLGVLPLFGVFGAAVSHALVIELSHFRHFWMVLAIIAGASMQAERLGVGAEVAPGMEPVEPEAAAA